MSSLPRLSLGFAALLLAGCQPPSAVEIPPPVVTFAVAAEEKVQDWDEYTGRLAPVATVEVRPRVSGYITEVKFKDGDVVKKGAVLFVIDPRPYQAAYDEAKGNFDKAEAAQKLSILELERSKKLRTSGAVAVADLDQKSATNQQATGAMESARSAMETAKLDLEFCTITAPIDGRTSLATVTVGNLVNENSDKAMTTIVSTNPIYAYSEVDERSLLRYARYYIKKRVDAEDIDEAKLPLQVGLQDETGYPHIGYIDFVDNRVDPATGTVRIRGVLDWENGLLSPGLFVRVRIPAGDAYSAVVVPQRAVSTDQGQKFVVVVGADSTAEFRHVEIGSLTGRLRVIKTGLKAGEKVVVDGVLKIRPGQKVDAKPLPPPEPEAAPAAESAKPAAK